MRRAHYLQLLALAAVFAGGCQGARTTELDDVDLAKASPSDPGGPSDLSGDGAAEDRSSGSASSSSKSGGSAPGPGGCFQDGFDHDGDGLSFAAGDCNDCDAKIRPGTIDMPGNGIDEDCSGKADDDATCDASLALASTDPLDAARALGVCRAVKASDPAWGVVAARWVKPDGSPLSDPTSYGILDAFGANGPTFGKKVLAISTGTARAPSQPGYDSPVGHDKDYVHGTPAGWPKASPLCPGVVPSADAHDGVALELTIKVPIDAHSMSFESAVFAYDYPQYVCSAYADAFVVIASPAPSGALDGDLVFDATRGPVDAASSLLQACSPGTHAGITFACGQGTTPLQGTGFEGHGATGWLRTTAPVDPASTIKLLFAVWDVGDGSYDTTVLLDALRFWTQPVTKVQTVAK